MGAVLLGVGSLAWAQVATLPFNEDFEGGAVLAPHWTVSGTANARTVVMSEQAPHGGLGHLGMDDTVQDFNNERNELTLTVDLDGMTQVVLRFWAREFGDEAHGPPTIPFDTEADFDGVAISADGLTWYEVQGLRDLTGTYQELVVDLDAAIATHGLAYTDTFRIRFNHYDNHPIPGDGIALDDISIAVETAVDPAHIWVDFGYAGTEVGTESMPFNTLGEGVGAVDAGGLVSIKGDTGTANSAEVMTLDTALTLEAIGGAVLIG